ncbi:MAG TPA: 3-phosphoserine/phosphohydroxythreonine transaminase [Phycisphaerales bacterium]|nr:3-phosphoserine/phosphohydroxythreonine transaminase [Phycisphaerales bacterium]
MTPSAAPASSKSAKPSPAGSGRLWNYSAGPGMMPDEVLRQIQEEVWNCRNSGVGILEHSHRAPVYDRILMEAFEDCRAVGNIPAGHQILFMTGGSTSQNYMVPMNLMPPDKSGTADYFDTGHWAAQSIEHARIFGTIHECGSSKADKYSWLPKAGRTKYSAKPAYVHYTSNNTIYGTQYAPGTEPTPPGGVPLVCDMCSDIFSRPFDVSKYALIYASAQKNLGAAGATLVIVRDDVVKAGRTDIPVMLQYRHFAATESRPNTPPVLSIYAMGLMLKWIRKMGGPAFFEKHNAEKAKIVYDVLDGSKFYTGHARVEDRSLMNVAFKCPTGALDDTFCAEAAKHGLDCLRGHRTAGGMRASLYNAMPKAGAKALAEFMVEFERTRG